MKKLVISFMAAMIITTFSVSTGFSTSYNVQRLEGMLVAQGINDYGSVVGSDGSGSYYVLYSNGIYTNVYLNYKGSQLSGISASSINNSNQVTGTYGSNTYGGNNAFCYDGTTFYDLNVAGAIATTSAAISNNGLIAGTYGAGSLSYWPPYHGFTNTLNGSSIVFNYVTIDANGISHENQTWVKDINNSGAIIGTYLDDNGQWHGFMFAENTYTTLAGMDTPLGINDAGQVVGLNNNLGVLYTNGVYTPLDFNGVPSDINNKGQIAGFYYGNDAAYAFIATPVPLPPTVLLLGSGLLGLMGFRKFWKN
jgi:hypothetical protein